MHASTRRLLARRCSLPANPDPVQLFRRRCQGHGQCIHLEWPIPPPTLSPPFISSEAGKVKLSASNLDSTPHSLPNQRILLAWARDLRPRPVQCEIWLSAVADRPRERRPTKPALNLTPPPPPPPPVSFSPHPSTSEGANEGKEGRKEVASERVTQFSASMCA